MEPVDLVGLAILGIALLRGLFRGLIREAFSIAALGAAVIAVRSFVWPMAAWLEELTSGKIGPDAALWIAGAVLAIGSIALVVIVGRLLRRGARWSGLGWADRAGGAVLGAAEGALVVGILLVAASGALGRRHPALADSRSLAALEEIERIAQKPGDVAADVAAPPRN